jgi:hypothetical protein
MRRVGLIMVGDGWMVGEEGSEENLVGLEVGDRPLFVQVSLGIPRGLSILDLVS